MTEAVVRSYPPHQRLRSSHLPLTRSWGQVIFLVTRGWSEVILYLKKRMRSKELEVTGYLQASENTYLGERSARHPFYEMAVLKCPTSTKEKCQWGLGHPLLENNLEVTLILHLKEISRTGLPSTWHLYGGQRNHPPPGYGGQAYPPPPEEIKRPGLYILHLKLIFTWKSGYSQPGNDMVIRGFLLCKKIGGPGLSSTWNWFGGQSNPPPSGDMVVRIFFSLEMILVVILSE